MHDLDNHQRNGSKTSGSKNNGSKNIDERNNVVDWRFEGNNLMGVAVMEMPELIQAARG